MKVRSLFAALALFGVANAQTTSPESRIQTALEALRANTLVHLELIGTQTTGTTVVNLDTTAFYQVDGETLKVEIRQRRDGNLVTRILGDGTTLWTYHNDGFSYAADPYGTWGQGVNPHYQADFFNLLTANSSKEITYPARILRETFAGDAAYYRSWVPTTTAQDGSTDDVVYSLGNPETRRVEFHLDSDGNGGYTLSEVFVKESQKVGTNLRVTEFTITVDTTTQPAADTFLASDVTGWKPVVRKRIGA